MATLNTANFFGVSLPTTLFPQNAVNGTSAAEALAGTALRDVIYGNGGADTVAGGLGDDTYIIQYQNVSVVEAAGGGVDTIKATLNFALPDNVENLYILGYSGYSGTTGIGNGGANLLVGDTNNQFLEGAGGNDVLIGGGGSDTFIFRAGSGFDAINDFQTGAPSSGGDVIRLAGYGINTYAEFQSHLTQQGADTLLTLDQNNAVLIRNTTATSFTADNFQGELDRSDFRLTFSEEFNGPISWYNTTTKTGTWLPEYGYYMIGSKASHDVIAYTGEEAIFVDPSWGGKYSTPLGLNPFNLHDGILEINSGAVPAEDSDALWGVEYYSGMLSSVQSFKQLYGYFEIRAKLPTQTGAWPSFWLSPVKGVPPEIDILEGHGTEPNVAHTTIHDVSLPNGKAGNTVFVQDAGSTFHTYGLLWTETDLVWYIDGAEVWRQATAADMHVPMYMLINLPIGAVGGPVDPDNLPRGFAIDYVRAYSLDAIPPVAGLTVNGGAGADSLVGGDGNDTINGGGGVDTLVGGAGNDTYYVDNGRDVVVEAASGGVDTVYSSVSWTATADAQIEKLIATGTGAIALTGNGFAMEIDGNAAINTLSDGGGADILAGGLGNDLYIVTNVATAVVETLGAGYDTVRTTLPSYTLTANVEVLTYAGAGNFFGKGNGLGNAIVGGAGNDTLDGGAGVDRLIGGKGDDTYYVDSASDTVVENAGEGRDTVLSTANSAIAPANVEVLKFVGTGTFIAHANNTGVSIQGGAGNDSLYGGGAADTLDGGGGSDLLSGGTGAVSDTFKLGAPGAGVDRIINFHGGGEDHLLLPGASYGLGSLAGVGFVNGSSAPAGHAAFVYDASGKLYWDATGGDPAHQVLIATFDGHPALSVSDFILG